MFDRKSPCKTCPFRTDETGLRNLGTDRAEGIVDLLMNDGTFSCHGDLGKSLAKRQHCVGAMLMLEKIDRPNQMMRIGERLGRYDRNKLRGANEVFDDFNDWVEVQE